MASFARDTKGEQWRSLQWTIIGSTAFLCLQHSSKAVHFTHRQAMQDAGGWYNITSQAISLQGCRLPGWLLAGHSRFPACLRHLPLSEEWLPCHALIMQASFGWTCATGVEGLVVWQIRRSSEAICMLSAGGNPVAEIPSHKVPQLLFNVSACPPSLHVSGRGHSRAVYAVHAGDCPCLDTTIACCRARSPICDRPVVLGGQAKRCTAIHTSRQAGGVVFLVKLIGAISDDKVSAEPQLDICTCQVQLNFDGTSVTLQVIKWCLLFESRLTLVIAAIAGLVQGIVDFLFECVTRPTVIFGLRADALL